MAGTTDIAPPAPDQQTPPIGGGQQPPPAKLSLSDQDRQKLDSIVQKMTANKEKDEDIQAVVNDFKQKYGGRQQSPAPQTPAGTPAQTPAAPGNPQDAAPATPAPEHQLSHTSLQDIRHLNDLANQPTRVTVSSGGVGAPGVSTPNPEDVARNKGFQTQYDKAVTDQAAAWGTDPVSTRRAFQDFPTVQDEKTLKSYADLAKTNPVNYQRIKDGTDIRQAIASSGQPGAFADAQNLHFDVSGTGSYQELQDQIASSQELLHKYGLGQEYFEKLKNVYAPLINTLQPGLHIQHWNSPDKDLGLSDFQYAGLETEKMFNPGKYSQDMEILKHNKGLDENPAGENTPVPVGKKGYAYDRGVENVLYALENQGRQNTGQYIDQRSVDLGKQIDQLKTQYQNAIHATTDPIEQRRLQAEFNANPLLAEADKLNEGQKDINYARSEDQTKFPLNFGDQAQRLVKDAMSGTSGVAGVLGKQVLLGAGETSDNTARFVKNTWINLLGSEQAKAENAASNIGHEALTQLSGYEGNEFSTQQPPLVIDPKIVTMIQAIGDNPNLSPEEKNDQANKILLAYPDAVKLNPLAGHQNLTWKAGAYTAANTLGQILGIADQSLLMGGLLGDASKAQKMASALTPMYASTQNQLYESALARGDEHPLLSSHLDATIVTLASMINPDVKVVKNMVGAETGLGKLIAGVDESTWNKVLSENKPLYDRMIAGTQATAKQLGLAGLQYGVIVPTAQYVVHKNVLNEDPNLGDALTDGLKQTLITMAIPALAHGAWGGIDAARVNPMQKGAIVEAGLHPKENIELIDQMVERGQVTPDRAEQIKEIIRQTGHILKNTDMVKSDGSPMNETDVADQTYQMLRKKVLEGKLKAAPDPQKPAIEAKIAEIDKSIAEIHTSEADKQKIELNNLLSSNLDRIKEKIQPMEGQVLEAIKRNEPEQIFQEIYDQATQTTKFEGRDVSTRPQAEETFGKALVDKAIELHNNKTTSDEKAANDAPQAGNQGQVAGKPEEGAAPRSPEAAEPAASSFLQSRHADTIHDEQGIVSGPNNKELSAKGRRDAADLANDVAGKGVTTVITSGLERSMETGKTVADKVGAKVESRPELNTWNIKDFDGLTDEEFKDVQKWFVDNPDKHAYDGPIEKFKGKEVGESVNQYAGRVLPAMERVEKESGPETLLINHSNNMMLWDAYLKNGRQWNDQARADYLNAKKPEPATLTSQGGTASDQGKMSYDEFKKRILNEYLNVESSKYDFNYTSKLTRKERVKAVADIQAGKNSAPARQLESELQAMHESGMVAINRGSGIAAFSTEIPFNEWFGLTDAERKAAENIDARTAEMIASEGITAENIDDLKHLFNGFPYDEEDFQAVKQHLSQSDQGGVPAQASGDGGQTAEPAAGGEPAGPEPAEPGGPVAGDGGAPPLSEENPFREPLEEIPTGIKRVISESVRTDWNLPEVEFTPRMERDAKLVKGKELVQDGAVNPAAVARRVLADGEKKGIYTPQEAMAMQYYSFQLKEAERNLRDDKAEADAILKKDPDNTAAFYAKLTVEQRLGQLADEVDMASRADRISGNSWSDIGDTMQIEADQSFSPINVTNTMRDNYGGNVPEAVQARLDKAFAERDAAIADMKAAKDEVARLNLEKDAKADESKDEGKEGKTAKSIKDKKDALRKERTSLIEELKKAIKKDSGNLGANPLPIHTIEAVSKLALNYFKDGVLTVEGITNKIYNDLKDVVEGIDKNQIRDAVASYQPLAREQEITKSQKKAATAEIEMQKLKQRQTANPDATIPLPEKRLVVPFEKNTEYIKAKQRLVNAEFRINQEKMRSYASKETYLQKTLGWANRLMRLSILSGYHVLAKLTSAALIGSATMKGPEEVMNGVWGAVFPKISDKADIDMGLNMLAVGRYYSHFFDIPQFARDAKDIVTSGETQLGKELEKQHFDHVPVLDLPTDLHQVIKSPVKRAMFEYTLTKILADQQSKSININHPLVMESARQRAFARAKYEVFMEDNSVSRQFGKWEAEWKDQGKIGAAKSFLLHFAFPVSKVPTNIARRLGLSVAGLPIGLAKAAKAYHAGIDNLSTDEANAIGRALTKGSIGIALWTAGFLGYKSLGGLNSRFDPNKQRKDEPLADEMNLGGKDIAKPWQHALPFEVMQMGATFRHIYEKTKGTTKSTPIAIAESTMGSTGAILQQIPVVETPVNLVTATQDPYQAKRLGDDLKRRVEPQILFDLGILNPAAKKTTDARQSNSAPKSAKGGARQ